MSADRKFSRLLEEVRPLLFHHPKQLRHAAEQAGFAFVPTEVVELSAERAHFILRPRGVGEVHVFAERSRHWYPFRVTGVERRSAGQRPDPPRATNGIREP